MKAGKHASGSQRYKCKLCQKRYTPQPSQMYPDAMRQQAVKLYADGLGFRQIAFGILDAHPAIQRVKSKGGPV